MVYSAKFVCGQDATQDSYNTEVNIHNFGLRPVTILKKAVQANPQGAPRGMMSQTFREALGAGEALQVNCRNIQEMLTRVPQVCPGKKEARDILANLLIRPLPLEGVQNGFPYEEVKVVIEMVDKAIHLEEEGQLAEALKLESEVVERLNKLIELAKTTNVRSKALVDALTRARDLIRRCMAVTDPVAGASGNAGQDVSPILPGLVEGFVAIETSTELEVTAVYRARSLANSGGGGISIDVEQIQPHRIARPMPLPTVTAKPVLR